MTVEAQFIKVWFAIDTNHQFLSRRVSKGGAFGACAPPLSLMPNEKIYGD